MPRIHPGGEEESKNDTAITIGAGTADGAGSAEMEVDSDPVPSAIVNGSKVQIQPTSSYPFGTASLRAKYCNKGALSNYLTFLIMVVGIVLCVLFPANLPAKYVLSLGLFGFAGGLTNWLAIKMLFDRIPGLIGSGVIPRRFKEIRETVKTTIMNTFFDEEYLEAYLQERAKGLLASLGLGNRIKDLLAAPEVDGLIAKKLEEAGSKPEGMMLQMAAQMLPNSYGGLVMFVKPALADFASEMAGKLETSFDLKEIIKVDRIRDEIDRLMTEKLKLLTAPMVKVRREWRKRGEAGKKGGNKRGFSHNLCFSLPC